MAKEVIVTAILVIASVVAVVAFVNAVIPSVYDLSNSYSSLADNMGDQVKSAIDIVFIYPDTAEKNVSVWIKNVGSTNIPLSKLGYSDVFVLSSSNYWNPGFESSTKPSWNYTVVNGRGGDTWNRGETIKVSIYFDNMPSNTTQITFFLYNGVSTSDKFST
jgi:archaeal flagellar protein FlaG